MLKHNIDIIVVETKSLLNCRFHAVCCGQNKILGDDASSALPNNVFILTVTDHCLKQKCNFDSLKYYRNNILESEYVRVTKHFLIRVRNMLCREIYKKTKININLQKQIRCIYVEFT